MLVLRIQAKEMVSKTSFAVPKLDQTVSLIFPYLK